MVSELIKEAVDPSANIKFGAQISEDLEDEIVITIVATGISKSDQMYSDSDGNDNYLSQQKKQDTTQTFTGFTSPGMEKRIKDENPETSNTGGLEFSMSDDEELDEELEIDSNDDSNPPFDLDSKDPLDVPAFMRKKDKK
jgi:cell division protein FtsZ